MPGKPEWLENPTIHFGTIAKVTAVIVATCLTLLPLWRMFGEPKWREARFHSFVREGDHEALRQACQYILAHRDEMRLDNARAGKAVSIDMEHPHLPPILQELNPRQITAGEYKVSVPMEYSYRYGFWYFVPTFEGYGQRELTDGLWTFKQRDLKFAGSKRRLFEWFVRDGDHQKLLEACRHVMSHRRELAITRQHAANAKEEDRIRIAKNGEKTPDIFKMLNPFEIYARKESVAVEMEAGEFGFYAFAEGKAGTGHKELLPGLWTFTKAEYIRLIPPE